MIRVFAPLFAALLLLAGCAPDPNAPPDVRWDHASCAECAMLVSDPGFAAALVLKDGTMLPFDDPGCLFKYLVEKAPPVHAMWFHDGAGDRWLRDGEVAFLPDKVSPMGSGLQPVPAGTPGAIGIGEASARAVAR